MTTGAFYGYFSSKEALFAAIVELIAAASWGSLWRPRPPSPSSLKNSNRITWGVESSDCIHWMVEYICQHREPVKLLLCRSEGTSYEHFVHNMVEVEVEYTLKYMEVLRRLGHDIPELDEQMCHIIASGMFNGIFEIVVHDMPRDRALRYVDQLRDFIQPDG